MKLLVDLYPCQMASWREEGRRYALALVREMARLRGQHELVAIASPEAPKSFEELRQQFNRLLPQGHFLPCQRASVEWDKPEGESQARMAEALAQQAYQAVSADVILYPAFLDGYGRPGVSPSPSRDIPTAKRAAVLYDFTPYRFREQYLDTQPAAYQQWYLARLEALQYFDLLFSPSEASRQEAIRLFGLAPEKVVALPGAAGPGVQPVDWEATERQAFLESLAASAQRAWEALEALEKSPARRYFPAVKSPSKPKIAYLSPIPPEKSGIAWYSAELLPSLAKHFDIDLFTTPGLPVDRKLAGQFKVFPWTELLERRAEYATAIYHMGNSTYHSHMFHLEQQFPGVVVLHDFYLGHLIIHDSIYQKLLPEKLEESHGLKSLLDLARRGMDEAIWDWPLNWPALRYAQELVVHSHYHETLLRQYYGLGWQPRPTVIKQLRSLVAEPPPARRRAVRQKLGIAADEFLICAFGFLVPSKLNLLTIAAFGQMLAATQGRARLVFVGGKGGPQAYNAEIDSLIAQMGLQDRIRITGFVNETDYEKYMLAADVAVQLRKNSRGETSRAVLDCMAHGIPTIINAHATFDDYSPSEVIKLPESPAVDDLAQALIRLYEDVSYRREKSQNALSAIRENHDPDKVAADFAEVIYRAIRTSDRCLFAPLLSDSTAPLPDYANLAAANLALRAQPRILMDVTATSNYDLRTGIQRVVKNLAREFLAYGPHFELIHFHEDWRHAYRFAEKLSALAPNSLPAEPAVEIRPGDTLFMADTGWYVYPQLVPLAKQVRKQGGQVIAMAYDILPVTHPEYFPSSLYEMFTSWLEFAITHSDMIVCISRATANEILAYIERRNLALPRRLDVNYIHLGADIQVAQGEGHIRKPVSYLVERFTKPMFLMVGTLEPRKGHHFVLEAFEQLWQEGAEVSLCFAGKLGQAWEMHALEQRIRTHPRARSRFFFIENPSDAEIEALYARSTAVITASVAEGFGLPIVEGALHNVPVLASDIPVFREVGGEGALYFSLESPAKLAEAVKTMLTLSPAERQALVDKVEILTWQQCAAWTREVLAGQRVYKSLRPRLGG